MCVSDFMLCVLLCGVHFCVCMCVCGWCMGVFVFLLQSFLQVLVFKRGYA